MHRRNVTLSGLPGLQAPPLLDLDFQQAVLQLCATCSLTLSHVALSSERHGNGAELDFVQGALQRNGAGPSSAVVMRNVTRVRSACLPPDVMLDGFAATAPSSHLRARIKPAQQQLQLRDATWQASDSFRPLRARTAAPVRRAARHILPAAALLTLPCCARCCACHQHRARSILSRCLQRASARTCRCQPARRAAPLAATQS